MKTGFITCALCNSRVTATARNYGGMPRLVCLNALCDNSEIALDLESN